MTAGAHAQCQASTRNVQADRPNPPRRLVCGGTVRQTIAGVLWLLLVALAMGCGSAQIAGETRPPAALRPKGIVVLPIALMQDGTTALDVAARSSDVAAWLLRNTDLPVVGPLEFTIQRPLDEVRVVHGDTDLPEVAAKLGVDLTDWVVLHVLVTENRATYMRDIVDERKKSEGGTGKTFRKHGIDAALHVEVTLLDPLRGQRLAFTMADSTDDPTVIPTAGDPRPGLARAIAKALMRLQTIAGPQLQGPPGRRHRGEWLVPSMQALVQYKVGELPPYQDTLDTFKGTDRQLRWFTVWDRFAPNTATADILAATKQPGLLVQRAMPPLEVGDVVVQVGSQPMQAVWQFDRALRACSDAGCTVQVWRKNAMQTLTLRWPALPAAAIPEQEAP